MSVEPAVPVAPLAGHRRLPVHGAVVRLWGCHAVGRLPQADTDRAPCPPAGFAGGVLRRVARPLGATAAKGAAPVRLADAGVQGGRQHAQSLSLSVVHLRQNGLPRNVYSPQRMRLNSRHVRSGDSCFHVHVHNFVCSPASPCCSTCWRCRLTVPCRHPASTAIR